MDVPMTDAELLGRFVDDKDQQAFAELVQRHVHWVNSMARRIVGDDSLANDATQAAFIHLSRKAASLRHKTLL
jgi:DNA-directed RNA polymerase specialized sigma24 family protein